MATPSLQSRSLAVIKGSTHYIEVNYSESKHLPVGQYISSPTFSAEGYDWALQFYPHGTLHPDNKETHIALFLQFLSEMNEVQAEFFLNVEDQQGKLSTACEPFVHTFTRHPKHDNWGYIGFISRDELEDNFCEDGMVVVSCKIRVLSASSGIDNCSGGLCQDMEKLLGRGERFDVTFEVQEERISAHKFMLASRSPVFEAEFYGSIEEAKSSSIKIKDMKAEVFKALLRFIYTDNFEDHELKGGLSVELIQDLFAAADRYALEKLKLQCQQRLYMALSVDTVLTTLILAERHSSAWLKEKCLQFASELKIYTRLAVTEEYVQMMQSYPSLFVEFRQKVTDLLDSLTNVAKEQKIG